MSDQDTSVTGARRWFKAGFFGALLLVGVTALSLQHVLRVQKELFDPDATIVRITHWQLERGYSDAMQKVIDDYEKMWAAKGKKVKVLQMPVTEKVYPQWLNTHMIAGDAPDISEQGKQDMLNNNPTYVARYYVPLTTVVNRPNPYNKGTKLEDVAWRESFMDGMRGAYNTTLQDYYSVPTAFFTTRLFYNMDMFREATGSDQPPRTLGELMSSCEKIRELGKKREAAGGYPIVPIQASNASTGIFLDRYLYPFTAGFEKDLDLDLDGLISDQEVYIGFRTGKVSFDDPRINAFFGCMRELATNFGTGFSTKDRQDAAFVFVQGRACMVATGSWDAASLFADPEFRVGVFDFPLPAPDEKYGEYVLGRGNEASVSAAGQYGVYRLSRNIDQAIDFLQFMTSQKYNKQMHREAQWIPAVIGTSPSGRMKPFACDPTGFSAKMNMYYGSDVQGVYNGKMQTYMEGQQPYEALVKEVTAAMNVPYGGDRAWFLDWNNGMVQLRSQERIMSVQILRELALDDRDAPLKIRQLLLQQVRANDGEGTRYRFQQVRGKPIEQWDREQ